MSEEVTKIINALCEKLGVGATYLIPELAKKSIAQDVVSIVICVIALFMIAMFVRWANGYMDDDSVFFLCIFPVFAGVIVFVVFWITLGDLAGWLASPTAMAIEKITGMIK
jgi:hypothetical protein